MQGGGQEGLVYPMLCPASNLLPCLARVAEKKGPLVQDGSCVQRRILPDRAAVLGMQCWIHTQRSSSSQACVGLSAHPFLQHVAVYTLRTGSMCCEQPELCCLTVGNKHFFLGFQI